MSRGTQDFGNIVSVYGATQIDFSELLFMLAGYGLIDSLGRTILSDTFAKGLGGWHSFNNGSASLPILMNDALTNQGVIFSTPFCLYFATGVTPGSISQISQQIVVGSQQKIGIEAGFFMYSGTCDIDLIMFFNSPIGFDKRAQVRISQQDKKVYVVTPGGVFTQVGTLPTISSGFFTRTQCKLVADWTNNLYTKLLIGDISYPVNTLQLTVGSGLSPGAASFQIEGVSKNIPTNDFYLGFVRCTKDEP